MPILIDGHNLIPKIPGLSLSNVDDEMALIEMLQEFSRSQRKKVEVVFDRAAIGESGVRQVGSIRVNFAPEGVAADKLIISRLNNLKDSARNWTVVSSDHWVQNNAKTVGARTMTSEQFAQLLCSKKSTAAPTPGDHPLSDQQIRYWMKLFSTRDEE